MGNDSARERGGSNGGLKDGDGERSLRVGPAACVVFGRTAVGITIPGIPDWLLVEARRDGTAAVAHEPSPASDAF